MKKETHRYDTIIVGSGAAAYNAADSLFDLGQKEIAIVTEGVNMGTSRNTGSDKQTYYKLSMCGKQTDSVYGLAQTLFSGGGMHGDTALVEAALSARCFFKLVQLGVPFPCDDYGQYAGYKTDHDPMLRATSSGPLTSRYMTEKLELSVRKKQITVYDGYRVIRILTEGEKEQKHIIGLIALKTEAGNGDPSLEFFCCKHIIWAVGGPAGLYGSSVYPPSQTGASGTAFLAGAVGNNVTEWQYGIASTRFRWNLSGSYQQVIPVYLSTDQEGNDPREFLYDYFDTPEEVFNAVFLKGYQWPFDPRKTTGAGSSKVDLAVYEEVKVKGRRVFLDYRSNPGKSGALGRFDFTLLGQEAYDYLKNSDILFGTPIERLKKMNLPAYELYLNHGIDLEKEPLEIDVCAQHNNGGLKVDCWWQSNLKGFFPVGEAAGTLGVYRPGGTALNSTQVGSLRAAQYIARNTTKENFCPEERFRENAWAAEEEIRSLYQSLRQNSPEKKPPMELRAIYQKEMERCGGIIRDSGLIEKQLKKIREYLDSFRESTYVSGIPQFRQAMINWDILTAQYVYLSAMKDYAEQGGFSRGSYLVKDQSGEMVFTGEDSQQARYFAGHVQEILYQPQDGSVQITYKPVRPIPDGEVWFETIYQKMRQEEG